MCAVKGYDNTARGIRLFVRIYFIAFYYFSVIIGVNLFVAFVLDMYSAVERLENEKLETIDMIEAELRAAPDTKAGLENAQLVKDGAGIMRYANNSCYEGLWKMGLRHGKGRVIHPDGDCYVGEWADDMAHGVGTFTDQAGYKYEGEWVHDQ